MSEFSNGIPALFERQVGTNAEGVALRTHDRSVTYAELNYAANQLARFIVSSEREITEPVVLLLEQGISMVTAILAVLKAGGFFVPVDPTDPESRTIQILKDSGTRFIITNSANFDLATGLMSASENICLNLDEVPANLDGTDLSLDIAPGALAYILYTSGSTGTPKGVMQTHSAVIHNMRLHKKAFEITSDDIQTLLYGASVYGGIRDTFNAILNGATLSMYSLRRNGFFELGDWLRDEKITIYCSVVSVFRQFMKLVDDGDSFPAVRLIKLGSDATYLKDVIAFQQASFSSSCVMHCGLGSTETGLVREYFLTRNVDFNQSRVPLGFPVEDKEILILDDNGKPLPPGEIGEIAIKSKYISTGYWQQPELTHAVFSADQAGMRMYRTGDLGQIDDDGCLAHRGRADYQIKIRGFRVELGEIETALRAFEQVYETVVIATEDERSGWQLIAYIVPDGNSEITISDLREFLFKKLPGHMLPKCFVFLDSMPCTSNGKVDRQALPAPELNNSAGDHEGRAPRSEIEKLFIDIWKNVLKVSTPNIDSNFFDLGGDSLSAVEIILQMEACIGQRIPLTSLVQAPTIAELVDLLEADNVLTDSFLLNPSSQSNSRLPLFCLYGLMIYQPLADLLADQYATYGLYLDEELNFSKATDRPGAYELPDVSEIARLYLEKILSIHPNGPYCLAGVSFGGVVAFEVAQQLQALGKEVGAVILIDTSAPGGYKPVTLRGWLHYFREEMIWRGRRIVSQVGAINNKGKAIPREFVKADLDTIRRQIRGKARRDYRVRPLNGKGVLFKAREGIHRPGYKVDPHFGWDGVFSTPLEMHSVPGDHLSVLQSPNVKFLADALKEYLNQEFDCATSSFVRR